VSNLRSNASSSNNEYRIFARESDTIDILSRLMAMVASPRRFSAFATVADAGGYLSSSWIGAVLAQFT